MEGNLKHYVARNGEQISETFETAGQAIVWAQQWVRSGSHNFALNMAIQGLSFCIRPEVNTWGTEDAETIAYIENARYDAHMERERARGILERAIAAGVSAEDAETYIEFGGR